ncbi:hypothetical protein [Halovulum sp. GXIMD14793]
MAPIAADLSKPLWAEVTPDASALVFCGQDTWDPNQKIEVFDGSAKLIGTPSGTAVATLCQSQRSNAIRFADGWLRVGAELQFYFPGYEPGDAFFINPKDSSVKGTDFILNEEQLGVDDHGIAISHWISDGWLAHATTGSEMNGNATYVLIRSDEQLIEKRDGRYLLDERGKQRGNMGFKGPVISPDNGRLALLRYDWNEAMSGLSYSLHVIDLDAESKEPGWQLLKAMGHFCRITR